MIHDSHSTFGRTSSAIIVVAILGTLGCGSDSPQTFPVTGKVTYPDGTPVTGGMVELRPEEQSEKKRRNARGVIQADGSYFLTTFVEGDGAMPGHHRVIVQEPYPDADEGKIISPSPIDAKYRRYKTSGLEINVKEETNEIAIVVTRPR